MSERPIDIVRGIYGAWSQGDFGPGSERFDEASVFILHPEFPDAGVYVGPQEMESYMRNFLEPWEQLTITCLDLTEVGDTVVAEVEQAGRGELSGAMTGFRYFQVWTFRGGVLMRLENFMRREQAQAAVGAAESP